MHRILAALLLMFLAACSNPSTHVMTGAARTPTDPASVHLYYSTPTQPYVAIATVQSNSEGQLHATAQGRVEGALQRLKEEAAKLGANGILMSSAGESSGGSAAGVATASGSTANDTGAAAPAMQGVASGTAIWVEN